MGESERSRVNESRRLVKKGEGRGKKVKKVEYVSLYIIILYLLLSSLSPPCVRPTIDAHICTLMRDRGERRKKSILIVGAAYSARDEQLQIVATEGLDGR